MRPFGTRPQGWVRFAAAGALLLICSGLSAVPSAAAERAVSTALGGELPSANLRVADGKILLTLEEAVDLALQRNLGLVIERYNREQFRLGITNARGIFDLNLAASSSWTDSETPTSSRLAGASVLQSNSQNFNLSLAQLDPWGGETTLQFNNTRSESNNSFSAINPAFSSGLQLQYALPLLRGFGTASTQRGVRVAKLQAQGNLRAFEQQLTDLVERVENAYWDLVEAQNQLLVARESLALAEELHRRNRVQVDVGTKPPLELVQSEANIATRLEGIIQATTAVGNAGDALRLLLNIDQGALWDAEVVAETDPRRPPAEIDLARAIERALAARPELAGQKIELERLEIEAKFARQQTLPRLDLGLGYNFSGVGGDVLEVDDQGNVTGRINGGWNDAFKQVTKADFPTWQVSLQLAYPLQNRTARAQSAIAQADLDRGRVVLTQLQQQIVTEVRNAARQVRAAAQQIEAAGASRVLQERNLDAQQKRYENGMSTSFEVTQVQEDLSLAKSNEVQAIAGYRRALAAYHRAIGDLLGENGITIDDPGAGETKN